VLEGALRRRLPTVGPPDPLVEALAGDWRTPAATLAAGAGITERQVHRRFVEAVGYGPKFLQRVLRFQAFLAAAASLPGARLGELAASAGYADQPHLTREARALAGLTPAELRANRVRNVQDSGRPAA
jgi:AraC-like DNA-binding protein